MDEVYKKARAKINLTLNVLNKREDGYHNIESVFQKISLYDEIYVKRCNNEDFLEIKSNVKSLEGSNNIIYKAYKLLKEEYDTIKGVQVFLKKNIPMQAGLAGGSTDCASFIECMNELFGLNLSFADMQAIGVRLGADVPATFYREPIIAKGIGDIIENIDKKIKFYLVIIKPDFSCDTKAMFEKLDKTSEIKQEYNSQIVKEAIITNNIELLVNSLYNVFENSVDNIKDIKEELLKQGALGSLMTGSGSCIYGIFKQKAQAKIAFRRLSRIYDTYFSIV